MAGPRADNQSPELFGQTPSQTVGPFFHFGLPWKGGADLVGKSDLGARPELFSPEHYVLRNAAERSTPEGEIIEIVGSVVDGKGDAVPDAIIEIWQANSYGRYDSASDDREDVALDRNFRGFGRSSTSEQGEFRFRTVRPGPVPGLGNSRQSPHIAVSVLARGLLKRLATRIYFGDEDNELDPILSLVPIDRRHTLVAEMEQPGVWRFDIVLQRDGETVFFDL